MKGYITNGKCYIFPQTAAEIPEVEATSYYVQEENFTEWVAENESIADKLVKYNYNLMSVQPKEWAGHEDDDLSPVYDITLSGAQSLIQNLSLNKSKAAEDESITITPGGSSYTAQWVDVYSTDSPVTWDNTNSLWGFTMPASDVTVLAEERTLYHITKSGDLANDFSIEPSTYMPQHEYQYDSYVHLVPTDATTINPTNGYTMAVQTDEATPLPVSASWDSVNSYWYFAMPASDVIATMTHVTLYDVVYGGDYSSIITNTNISSAAEGQVLVFEAQSGIDLYNDYVIKVADISDQSIPIDAPTAVNNTLTFTMPAKNVYITITPKPQNSTITVVLQDTLDGQPYGDPIELSSDSYEVGSNQVIDLAFVMNDGTYSNPTCSDETFVDWSFDPGNEEDDPETDESEAYNATITITSVPNEDLTFSIEHSVD